MSNRILRALEQDVLLGAKALLGADIVFGDLRARIVEVEAYRTPDDPASHSQRGRTPRNWVMFERAGLAYVYFNYGVHWMLNVTAHEPGNAAAVLIRAARPLEGVDNMFARRPKAKSERDLLSGPGKLAAALGLSQEQNGWDLFSPASELRIEEGVPALAVMAGPRVGIKVGTEHLWRFIDAESVPWVSRPLPPEVHSSEIPPDARPTRLPKASP